MRTAYSRRLSTRKANFKLTPRFSYILRAMQYIGKIFHLSTPKMRLEGRASDDAEQRSTHEREKDCWNCLDRIVRPAGFQLRTQIAANIGSLYENSLPSADRPASLISQMKGRERRVRGEGTECARFVQGNERTKERRKEGRELMSFGRA